MGSADGLWGFKNKASLERVLSERFNAVGQGNACKKKTDSGLQRAPVGQLRSSPSCNTCCHSAPGVVCSTRWARAPA